MFYSYDTDSDDTDIDVSCTLMPGNEHLSWKEMKGNEIIDEIY